MTLTYLGEVSFGEAAPLCVVINAQLAQAIAAALGQLEGQLEGLARVSAAITFKPPGFDATLRGAATMVANLRVTGPSLTLQGAAVLDIIAGLRLQIAALRAMIQIPLGGAIHAYFYDGRAAGFGGEVAAATAGGFPGGGGPTDHTNAVILATVEPATVVLLKGVFKTSL